MEKTDQRQGGSSNGPQCGSIEILCLGLYCFDLEHEDGAGRGLHEAGYHRSGHLRSVNGPTTSSRLAGGQDPKPRSLGTSFSRRVGRMLSGCFSRSLANPQTPQPRPKHRHPMLRHFLHQRFLQASQAGLPRRSNGREGANVRTSLMPPTWKL